MTAKTTLQLTPTPDAAPSQREPSKATRVHALVNGGPYPGMSEAFDLHMGHAAWTNPDSQQDAALWAAAWRAGLAAAPRGPQTETAALRDVLAERRRQIEAEGWTPEHDSEHDMGELAQAAACYALQAPPMKRQFVGMEDRGGTTWVQPEFWPWEPEAWKPKDRRSNLIRAGALILAEIERLDRAGQQK